MATVNSPQQQEQTQTLSTFFDISSANSKDKASVTPTRCLITSASFTKRTNSLFQIMTVTFTCFVSLLSCSPQQGIETAMLSLICGACGYCLFFFCHTHWRLTCFYRFVGISAFELVSSALNPLIDCLFKNCMNV